MNAVATRDEREVAPVQDINTGLLDVISRAARDPNVDIDKMERLLEMQERVHDRGARMAYAQALAEMQPRLPVISERGKILNKQGGVQSTYATWEDVNEAIRPLLAEHGFALSFRTGRNGAEITVTGVLSHRDGHSEETTIALPADTSGSKNSVQSIGSSTSYGKRYTAFALLNITSKGEDDGGVAGGREPTLNDSQVADLEALIQEVGADKRRFLAYLRENGCNCTDTLESIPAADFSKVVKALEAKRK